MVRTCVALALSAALVGCGKHEEAAAPTTTFTGKVVLHDEAGALLPDHSGTVISLYDAPATSTTTDADGSFSLANVAAGAHRLQIYKSVGTVSYGTYYTDEIATTAATYLLPQTVHLGRRLLGPQNYYDITYRSDNANKRLIVSGVRKTTITTDTRALYHRVFLDLPVGYDGGLDLSSFKFSRLYRNNLTTGFSDTIPFSVLTAQNVRPYVTMVVLNDNPRTDSCIAPFISTFPNGKTVRFARSYPSAGGFTGYTNVTWGR
ncbi:carboxypeptidase-like regulatory domain-containing protein [Hymenobacter monticola]|uniref:Carboxypeptidase-like regulatory domain-containing protein n=2 Tax=Hymenobacter monticola TaxID=1705399 RepID=A0ABY4B135_9BACT|nr:carboxypeptidase-like regulatory domain-containing protein [Hymenobacter monticola]UOE32529.1 carboxypeptidase-like regulatory domain-containing protein [Hymenobacter monticola]